MYPYQRYQNGGYDYEPAYIQGQHQNYGPQVQYQPQPPTNPFVAAPTPPSPALPKAQKRNNLKRRTVAPVVPQPMGNVVPAPTAAPTLPPNSSPNEIIPPGLKWALVPDSKPATIQIGDKPEPEPSKPNEELTVAQTAADKLQRIVEAAVICLIEPRTQYPLEKFGITAAFLPQRKIEVLNGTTAIGSIIISGIEYLKIHGLPCISQDRLLGRCKFLSFNETGGRH